MSNLNSNNEIVFGVRRIAWRLPRFSIGFAALCLPVALYAQADFPNKPIRILVGFPAASTADIIARQLAGKLTESLGQQVLVENRAGAGSSIAAEAVVRAPGDGHTLLLSTIANSINPSLFKVSFDFQKDLAAVSLLAESPGLLAAHPSAPPSIKELIAQAKASPGAISYASAGTGTVTHLYGELFNLATGVKLAHVPYKGSGQAQIDLMAGHIKLLFTPAASVVGPIKAGKLIALGSIGRDSMASLPGVPTLASAGVAGFDAGLWFGLNATGTTPRAVIERLNQESQKILQLADVRKQFSAQEIQAIGGSSDSFALFIRQETEKWARVVKAADIKAE
ncbi:MAG: Bug family tripartite tricarboxylate transporter substrate binding protein [Burkholderiales bacterium]